MSAPVLTELACAKVNLFLHVVGRRADGYHFLDSLVVFSAAADVLQAYPGDALTLAISGEFSSQLQSDQDNLAVRAAKALAASAGIAPSVCLHLDKRLPVAAGIGGGSADAAATLRLLVRLWRLQLDAQVLAGVAATLGADVPVCLASGPARMGGIGDILQPPPSLPAFGLLLINPGVPLATAAVFRSLAGATTPAAHLPPGWSHAGAMAADLTACSNDLEAPALAICPEIGSVLAALRGHPDCLLARMSGSGATCFGIFADAAAASAAATALARPDWWCAAGVRPACGAGMVAGQ